MLLLLNRDVQQLLNMDTCLNALEEGYEDLMNGQAGYIPQVHLHSPGLTPDTSYRWGNVEGADAKKGYFALRIKSDITYSPDGKTDEKYCIEPGTYCGLAFLFSTRTAEPLAIFVDGYMQHLRVGGCAGLGVKYLSRPESSVVGIIGSGGMARTYLEAFSRVRPITRASAFSPNRSHLEAYCQEMATALGIPVEAVDSAEKVFKGADIVATCTDSRVPVFDPAWLEPGQHYTNLTLREMDHQKVIDRCDVVIKLGHHSLNPKVDLGADMVFYGDTASLFIGKRRAHSSRQKLDITAYPHLVDLMAGRTPGRTGNSQITLFINGGTEGLQFASVAGKVYEMARAQGLGKDLPTEWFLGHIRS